jgi:peptidoglycan/LPS O-acetylase OafA/YrhL
MKNNNYRLDVDGLRALSVLAVLFYHLEIFNIPGGFLGVDIFFVISGYIITRLILTESENNEFNLSNFYIRRIRRIFPALILTLIITNIISLLLHFPDEYSYLSRANLSVLFFISNFFFWKNTDYFNELTSQSPLLHTWSLSVEEQFYVIFPLLFLIFYKLKNKNFLFYFILFFSVLSLLSSYYLGKISPDPNFFFTTSRVFEIGIGSITALIEKKKFFINLKKNCNSFYLNLITLILLIILISCFFYYDQRMNLPNFKTLVPLLSCSFIVLFNNQSFLINRVLTNGFSNLIGKMSYGIYLYHFPIIIFFNYFGLNHIKILVIPIIFLISFLSWKYFEIPFRKNNIISLRILLTFIIISFLVFLINYKFNDKIKNDLSISIPSQYHHVFKQIEIEKNMILDDNECRFYESIRNFNDEVFLKRIEACKKKYGKFLYLAGGSHVHDLYKSVYLNLSDEKFVVGNFAGSCAIFYKHPDCDYTKIMKFLENNKKDIKTFFYTQVGSDYLKNFYGPKAETKYIDMLASFLIEVQKLDIKLIWFGPKPIPNIEMNYKLVRSLKSNKFNFYSLKHVVAADNYMKEVSKKNNIKFISILDIIKYDPNIDFYLDEQITYRDSDHWSIFGAKYFGNKIFKSKEFLN